MMRKALSFLGCLLLSIGSVAAEPSKWLSQDQYWFWENGASTSTTVDGEQVVRTLTAGDTIAYCTLYTAQTAEVDDVDAEGEPILKRVLRFTAVNENDKANLVDEIPDGGYFVRMNVKFTPREKPNLVVDNMLNDFPFRTILYVRSSDHKLAFFERNDEEPRAEEIVTDKVVGAEEELDLTVQVLKDNVFRLYIGTEEVTVDGQKRAYRSLQTGEGKHFYADSMHSFAFIGSQSFKAIDFTTTNPFSKVVTSIPFAFEYDSNAVKDVKLEGNALDGDVVLTPGKTYTITFTEDTKQYTFGEPALSGNAAELDSSSASEIKFTVASNLSHENTLKLTLPSKAYFFTLNGEKYGTFSEIIAAATASGEKIELANDINLDSTVSPGAQAHVDEGQNVVIDLKGKTIKGLVYRPEANDAAILNSGKLKIIDTVGGGKVVANGYALATSTRPDAVLDTLVLQNDNEESETTIKAGIFMGLISNSKGKLQIDGGKFYKYYAEDTAENFYLRREKGVAISARFDNASFTTIDGKDFWTGDENPNLVEFRVDVPVYATLSKKLYTKEEYDVGTRPSVTAAGYAVSAEKIEWKADSDDSSIVRGKLTANTYTLTFDALGKATDPLDPESYTVDSEVIELPTVNSKLWEFKGWYVDGLDKKVTSLGDFATYEGSNGVLPEDLIWGDLKLVAKWAPKEIVWTNATNPKRGKGPTEANGLFDHTDNTYWTVSLPSGMNDLDEGAEVALKSISFATVNASPRNLSRLSTTLYLVLDEDCSATAPDYSLFTNSKDDFDYFETQNGYRPKIVYTFPAEARPVVKVGSEYTIYFKKSAEPMLLRLIRTTDSALQVIGSCAYDPEVEYQFYVPMYEIKGEAK